MVLKRCSGSLLGIICFITDHVFLKSELTESSLSWKYFSGKFDEKIVVLFITVFVVSQLVDCRWVELKMFVKRIFPFTRSKETC